MRRYLTACVILPVVLCGCGGKTEPPEDLKAAVLKARDEAKAARGNKDPKAAEKAARRAEEAIERLRKLAVGEGQVAAAAKAVLAESDGAAREARHFAELADEERRLAEKLRGLKAKAYRAGRSTALSALFKGLSLAADQAGKKGLAGLPKPVQEAANCAADFAGRAPLAEGSPDWAGIAADMEKFAASPPPELAWVLAAGFLLGGQAELALIEAGALDPMNPPPLSGMTAAESMPLTFLLRGLIYRANGLNHLAVREFTGAITVHGGVGPAEELPPWLRARVHALSALGLLYEKDLAGADREIMEAVKADPQGPLAAFLTGERLAANGEYEKAAESLESAARAKGGDEWLARRVTERAREIRDKKGGAEPLFCDTGFLCQVALHYVGEAAKRSEPARKLQRSLDSAKGFGAQFRRHLPGGEKVAPETSAEGPGGTQ